MRSNLWPIGFLLGLSAAAPIYGESDVPPAPNGIELPAGYKNWRVIGISHRTDNQSLRVILGNDRAIEAARAGDTNPWPKGTVLAKIVLKDAKHAAWPAATVPGKFVHAEFMIKDPEKYEDTGGWGYARWVGEDQIPYGKSEHFDQECFGCHTPRKENDYVFTQPIPFP